MNPTFLIALPSTHGYLNGPLLFLGFFSLVFGHSTLGSKDILVQEQTQQQHNLTTGHSLSAKQLATFNM